MSSYKAIDFSYPSIGQQKRTKLNEEEEGKLCPFHEKKKQEKLKADNKEKKKSLVKKLYDKNSLERKLSMHGIKMKVKCKKKRIQPGDESNDSDGIGENKFTTNELNCLTSLQLNQLITTFDDTIKDLTKELTEITEENERHSGDTEGLKMTVGRLEELALRVMKPWVNMMPHSDEMTRVMLLN